MAISKPDLALIEQIAKHIVKGLTHQQIAIAGDLDLSTVDRIVANPKFEEVFQTLDPKGYSKWKDAQADLAAKRQVMVMAREDSVEYYKIGRAHV